VRISIFASTTFCQIEDKYHLANVDMWRLSLFLKGLGIATSFLDVAEVAQRWIYTECISSDSSPNRFDWV
jgi:hypothetical protein